MAVLSASMATSEPQGKHESIYTAACATVLLDYVQEEVTEEEKGRCRAEGAVSTPVFATST